MNKFLENEKIGRELWFNFCQYKKLGTNEFTKNIYDTLKPGGEFLITKDFFSFHFTISFLTEIIENSEKQRNIAMGLQEERNTEYKTAEAQGVFRRELFAPNEGLPRERFGEDMDLALAFQREVRV